MGVQLNIKDEKTVRLARELSSKTGKSVTETIRAALQRATAEREAEVAERIAVMNAAVDRVRQHLPDDWKNGTSKEIMDEIYDDGGLPV